MNRICLILVMFLICCLSDIYGQQGEIEISNDFYKHYKGTLKKLKSNSTQGEEFDICLNMRRKGNQITGSFYSSGDNVFYTIKGKMLNNKVFELTQYHNKTIKGTFRGVFKSESKASGSWKDTKGELTYPFNITEDYINSVKFDSYTDTSYYHIEENPDLPYIRVSIDYLYPLQYTNKTSLQILRMSLDKDFFGTYSATGDPSQSVVKKKISSFSDYKNINEKQFNAARTSKNLRKENYNQYDREVYFRTNVIFNNDGILTVCKDSLEKVGGQSIAEGISYFVYDLSTGKRIHLKNLFYYPNYREMMKDLFEKKLMKGYGYTTMIEMIDNGYDQDYILVHPFNFFIDRYGIGFYFEAYSLNEKAIQIYFPFEEIAQYLKEESPISSLYPPSMVFQRREEIKEPEIEQEASGNEEEDNGQFSDEFQDQIIIDIQEGDVQFPDGETSEDGEVIMQD